jgi:hypothetical protein
MHFWVPPQESGLALHLQWPLSQTGVVPPQLSLHESGVWHWLPWQVWPAPQQAGPQTRAASQQLAPPRQVWLEVQH